MKLDFVRLCIVLAFSVAYVSTQAVAKDADDQVFMAQLAQLQQQCKLWQAESNRREQELETKKANASLPPQEMKEVKEKIKILKDGLTKTDALLAEPLPTTKEKRESYLRQVSGEIATTRALEGTVAKNLKLDYASQAERVLSTLNLSVEDFKTRYGAFDQQPAYNPDLNAPVPQGENTNFFGIAGQLPPSAIHKNQVSSGYKPTTVQEAAKIALDDHGVPGGIMLEGTAGGLDPVSRVEYDGSVNALVLNDDLVYFVKIPPWSLATMCREIGTDRNALLGVSETMTEGLVFGDKPEIYQGSDLAYELMLADKFLGDVVFGRPNAWTQGYKFPTTQPKEAKIKSGMLVRFAFGNFTFAKNNDGQLSVVSSSLEVRMLPVSKVASPKGQMLPNYNDLDNRWAPPKAFIDNAHILADNLDYFRREPLIEDVFAYGEAAAVLRSIKESGRDLNALADQIETGK